MSRQDEETAGPPVEETHHWALPGAERDLSGMTLGDFQVERILGRGGMGEVYLARQISLNRPVALKVLRPDLLTKPTYLSRFEAEATAVAKLNHPNIVHVYTLGSVDGVRFIAMEYVQGTNLRDYLHKKGALDYPLAFSIMKQAAQAVGAAGDIGLVHRDIKPENLLLTRKGQVKVADFGLCRDQDSARVHLTQPGLTMGTPLYMSPEQAQGKPLDHRSDLYSLGVTFYHMIAGEPPFRADSAIAMALKHVNDTPPSMLVFRSDVPPDLDKLVLKLMAKPKADRYQSAGEMLRDLARIREAMHATSGPIVVGDVGSIASPVVPAREKDKEKEPEKAKAKEAGREKPKPKAASGLADSEIGPSPIALPAPSRGLLSLLVAVALLVGAGVGWVSRPEDLLSESAARPQSLPGLWIASGWKDVEKRSSAEEQYHVAQLRARGDAREAAWLAVPGYFPESREWASRAYTQLVRVLLRRHDAEKLAVLAGELERWDGARAHERELAGITRAAADALTGEIEGVLEEFARRADPKVMIDPALVELSLEVTHEAEQVIARSGSHERIARAGLRKIQADLLSKLH
jgi:serine/threonine protein kinase